MRPEGLPGVPREVALGVYCDIRHGCEVLGSSQQNLMFGTFTLAGDDATVERLSAAWRQFERNYLSRKCKGALTYRVFEAGGRRGRPTSILSLLLPCRWCPKSAGMSARRIGRPG